MTNVSITDEVQAAILSGCAQGAWGHLFGRRDSTKEQVIILAAQPAGMPRPRHLMCLGTWGPNTRFAPTFPKPHDLFAVGQGDSIQMHWALSQGLQPLPHTVGLADEVFARLHGVVDVRSLQGKTVAVIGLGSVGSVMTIELAKAGINRIVLIDPDVMSATNVCRHAGDLHDLGKSKVSLMQEKILARNPSATVETIRADALELGQDFWNERSGRLALLIAASDSPSVTHYINTLSQQFKIPCVWCGLYERARWGHVIFSVPGKTPCLQCVIPALTDIQDIAPRHQRVVDYGNTTEPVKAEPGLGAAISTVALCATQVALTLVQHGVGDRSHLSADRNLFVFPNTPGSIFSTTAAFKGSWVQTTKKPNCTGCGEHPDRGALRQRVADMVDALEVI